MAGLILFAGAIFELRSAARATEKESVAEARLKAAEAESLRQQRELVDTYFKSGCVAKRARRTRNLPHRAGFGAGV